MSVRISARLANRIVESDRPKRLCDDLVIYRQTTIVQGSPGIL